MLELYFFYKQEKRDGLFNHGGRFHENVEPLCL